MRSSNVTSCHVGTALALAGLTWTLSLVFTLEARLHVKAWYNAANMAGFSFIISLFVVSHHLLPQRQMLRLRCKPYWVIQTVLNSLYLLLMVAAVAATVSLLVLSITLNFDYLGSLLFALVNTALLLYLLIRSVQEYKATSLQVYIATRSSPSTDPSDRNSCNSDPDGSEGVFKRGIKLSLSVLYWILHSLFHAILLVLIATTLYQLFSIATDLVKYRDTADMYTVRVPGHRPLAMYMRCIGSGRETIVFESGLLGTVNMQWPFIPRELQSKYRVCVYDRRDYGWSEGYNNDYVTASPPQPENSVEFFHALVKAANIPTPFYLVGHSYGGTHATYVALLYPQLLKGVIYLDGWEWNAWGEDFSGVAPGYEVLLDVGQNVIPLGILRIPFVSSLVLDKVLDSVLFRSEYTSDLLNNIKASILSGSFVTGAIREWSVLKPSTSASDDRQLFAPTALLENLLLASPQLDTPVFSIETSGNGEYYFTRYASKFFSKWRSDGAFVTSVPGSSHVSIAYRATTARQTAKLIDYFIQYNSGLITLAEFMNLKGYVT